MSYPKIVQSLLKVTARFSQTFSDFPRRFFAALLSLPHQYIEKTIFLFLSGERVHQAIRSEMDSLMNPVDANSIERVAEIGDLLAQALTRLQTCKSSAFSGEGGESSLHFSPDQSGDASPRSEEIFDG